MSAVSALGNETAVVFWKRTV